MFYVIFEHGMTYVWFGCVDNVQPTCNGRGQGERVTVYARSQVYMADIAKQNIWGAQWDLETADGVLC